MQIAHQLVGGGLDKPWSDVDNRFPGDDELVWRWLLEVLSGEAARQLFKLLEMVSCVLAQR